MKVIYTLGTSTRTIEEFIGLLKQYNIQTLIDVRRFPTSKFEWFKKENLKKFVKEAGIEYVWLGNLLGGYRSGGYEAYTKTHAFRNGINKIKEFAFALFWGGNAKGVPQRREGFVAILCAERLPWMCHRRFISAELERIGFEVVHIIDEKRVWKSNICKGFVRNSLYKSREEVI